MKLEDLGYDLKTWVHDRRLTHAESVFVGLLWVDHVGMKNAISAEDFAILFAYGFGGETLNPDFATDRMEIERWKRDVRYMQTHILEEHDDIPVISKAGEGGGYWVAAGKEEASEYYYTMRKRGLRGLVKATRGKRAAVVEAVEQLAFEFDDLTDRTAIVAKGIPRTAEPMAPEIVDALLSKMTRDPEKFASTLRILREKYFSPGAVLLKKESLAAMRAKAQEMTDLVASLG